MEIPETKLLCALVVIAISIEFSYMANIFFHNMKFTAVNVTYDPDYYTNVSYWISNGSLNAELDTLTQASYGLRALVKVQIKLSGSQKYQTLFSYDFDLCKIINEQTRDSLLKNWFRNVLKYSNLMKNCPIMEGHYYVRNLIMEPDSIPAYLRVGDYRLDGCAYMGKLKTKKEKQIVHVIADLQIY